MHGNGKFLSTIEVTGLLEIIKGGPGTIGIFPYSLDLATMCDNPETRPNEDPKMTALP